MATLSKFRANSTAINDGTWIALEEFGDLEIQTRGFTDAYNDARAAKLRRAAQNYGNDITKIPTAESRGIIVDLLIKHCLLDVRNLTDNGEPVTIDQFKQLIAREEYVDLYAACAVAAQRVTNMRMSETDDAKKNSPTL